MKYPFLLSFFLMSGAAFCQDGLLPLDAQKKVFYEDVATVQKSKDQLFESAQKWVVKTFGNYENAVTQQDLSTGKLVISSYVPVGTSSYEYVRFTLTLACQDQRYQVRIHELDGISQIHSPVRLGVKDNDLVAERAMTLKTELNRRKRDEADVLLKNAKADNERVNSAMFSLMASLKQYLVANVAE